MAANDDLQDAAIRHQIDLEKHTDDNTLEVIALLALFAGALEEQLRANAALLDSPARRSIALNQVSSARLRRLSRAIRRQARELNRALREKLRPILRALAALEAEIAAMHLVRAAKVDWGVKNVAAETLRDILSGAIIRGQTLRQWFKRLSDTRAANLEAALRVGMLEGDTIDEIVNRFREVEQISERAARALVRTATNAVANRSRLALYEENSDIVEMVQWVSVLDSKTSAICRARDGLRWPIGSNHPIPPAHPNCRSTIAPIIKGWDDVAQTGGMDAGRGSTNFEDLARERFRRLGLTPEQIEDRINGVRDSMNGKVPFSTTYQDFLRRQPAAFQDEVLGPTRGRLFRRGELPLDRFVNMDTGHRFTIDELRQRERSAFSKAGL